MERVRTISSALAITAMAFGLSACQGVDTPPLDTTSPNAETIQAAQSSQQTSRAAIYAASSASKTYTEEEEEFYLKQEDAWIELLEGLDVDTVGKLKKNLVTPYGVKNVYDPYQDPVVEIVFKKLYEERQESDYFDDWPETLIERSQRNKAREYDYFGRSDVSLKPTRILRNARFAQKNDYVRAGCLGPSHLSCLGPYISTFRPCTSESDMGWGSSLLSECEADSVPRRSEEEEVIPLGNWPKPGEPKVCYFEDDLPSIPRPQGYENHYLPIHEKQIGDPMRGTVKQQFDQYFAITCSRFHNFQSQ